MGVALTSVRRMVPGDLDVVTTMESSLQIKPWSEKMFRDELAADNRVYLVAEDVEVVGFGGVMVIGEEAHITNLLVVPERRRTGLGRRLMLELMSESVDMGARHATLEVRRANEGARELYRSLGLVPVGVRPRYYGDDDALIMWLHDIDRPGLLEGLR